MPAPEDVGALDDEPGLSMALRRQVAERYRTFFQELKQRFIERDDVIDQIALALLAKEHVLLTGPPGTAKSALSKSVLSNIVDRNSGAPSVFARQFTESTVQTDLIGPLDFKTLMESGRTEHFTDEGMLGAVHAFLDEVLDGRDMLLRATLNVLHERELKQGSKTTKGAIECALMTTNRYLSEVMVQSRETLLAFVDRIAFVAFIPKAFGESKNLVTVVSQQMSPGAKRPMPKLTLQDVDLLQELVDYVRFPDAIGEKLVTFLERLERELSAATRADPSFVPTRYISTRTVVRTAKILKAICVYDWIVNDAARPLTVQGKDFAALRLTLLLAGPAPRHVPSLLEQNHDARERNQLGILRTEHEVFERVVRELPADPAGATTRTEKPISLVQFRGQSVEQQVASCEKLLSIAEQGGLVGLEARERLAQATDILAHHALNRALQAGIVEHEGEFAVGNLERLAALMDQAYPGAQSLVPMLRTRALEVLEAQLLASLTTTAATLHDLGQRRWTLADSLKHVEERMSYIEGKWRLRSALLAGGATADEQAEARWRAGTERLETEVVRLWELGFDALLREVGDASSSGGSDFDRVLDAIEEPLLKMRNCGRWFEQFGSDESAIAVRVVGTKLMPFIRRAINAEKQRARDGVAKEVERLLQRLDDADVHWAIPSAALIEWAARALVDAEPWKARQTPPELSYEGYRAFRGAEPKGSLCFSLVEVCTHVALAAPELRAKRSPGVELIRDQLATLPEALVQELVEEDERRIRDTLSFFQRWWRRIVHVASPDEQLRDIQAGRFYALLDEESVLLRFALEAQLLVELFPEAGRVGAVLRSEIESFNQDVQRHVHSLLVSCSGKTKSVGDSG